MAGLINDLDKNEIRKIFQSLHDTYKRKIVIHRTAKNEVLVSTRSLNTNPLFGVNTSGKKTVANTPVYFETFARIYYKTDQVKQLFDGNDSNAFLSIPISDGEVKIVLDEQAFSFFKDVEMLEFDGIKMFAKSDVSREGLFGPMFYNVYLSRKQ